LREKLGELKIERNELRDRLHKLIDEAKANVRLIRLRMKNLRNIDHHYKEADKTSQKNFRDWSTD
jgi:CRISPR/Cas system-associated endoribonuclease Cas2